MLPSIVLTGKLIPFLLLMNHFEGTDKSLPFTILSPLLYYPLMHHHSRTTLYFLMFKIPFWLIVTSLSFSLMPAY